MDEEIEGQGEKAADLVTLREDAPAQSSFTSSSTRLISEKDVYPDRCALGLPLHPLEMQKTQDPLAMRWGGGQEKRNPNQRAFHPIPESRSALQKRPP